MICRLLLRLCKPLGLNKSPEEKKPKRNICLFLLLKTKAKLQYPDNESHYCQRKQIMPTLRISVVQISCSITSSYTREIKLSGNVSDMVSSRRRTPTGHGRNYKTHNQRSKTENETIHFGYSIAIAIQLNRQHKCSASNSHPETPDSTSRTRACSSCTSSARSPRPSRCRLYTLDNV